MPGDAFSFPSHLHLGILGARLLGEFCLFPFALPLPCFAGLSEVISAEIRSVCCLERSPNTPYNNKFNSFRGMFHFFGLVSFCYDLAQ